MKKKMGMRMLAAMLAASVVISASSGMVSAKGAGVSATGDVSDASSVSETVSRSSQYSGSAKSVSVEGAALDVQKIPSGLSGAGTEASPYLIGSLKDLLLMNRYINYESSSSKCFALSDDIDLSGARFSQFTNADGVYALVSAKATLSGNANVYFRLDGRNHKLYGMNLSVPNGRSTAAIFGVINKNSSVRNLTLEDCTLRVNHESEGAFAVLAVQNFGTLQNITMKDCVLDLRLASCKGASNSDKYLSSLACGRVYYGYALGVADNAGKVTSFTATGSDTNKGVFLKGARSYAGVIAGQNRGEIADAKISGLRIVSYGSADSDTAVAGKGDVAEAIGFAAGKNFAKNGKTPAAVVRAVSVDLCYGSDAMFGHRVGGLVGENDGAISDCAVRGARVDSAHLYGVGVYGGVAGVNAGTITSSGVYDVDFSFAGKNAENAYGGIAGENSGTVSECIASGAVNNGADSAASVGGIVGTVKTGTVLSGNYALVSVSTRGENSGALVGKNGSDSYVGKTNYWSSAVSGLLSAAPGTSGCQGDLTAATAVINVSAGKGAAEISAAALSQSWSGSKAIVSADLSKAVSVSASSIHVKSSASSVALSSAEAGAYGDLRYSVSVNAPAGVRGEKVSARVSIPVYVTASAGNGAGTTVKNPIVISSYNQLKMMKYAPDAHYCLAADITLGDDWTPVAFTGTLDGDGHTLYISSPVFSSVTGSRNDRVTDEHWKSLSSNLLSGYIYELNLVPVKRVDGGAFGTVSNATLRDVKYAASTEYEDGFVLLSASRSGALIDTLSGNDFLYRCSVSVPIAVTAMKSEGIGALAGYVSANHLLAENCSTSSLISLDKNLDRVGGLFGDLSAVRGSAKLVKCSATGCVYVTAAIKDVQANIMIGAAGKNTAADGCTYRVTVVSGSSAAQSAAPFTAGLQELKDTQKSESSLPDDVPLILPEVLAEDSLDTASLTADHTEVRNGNTVNVYYVSSKADLEAMRDMIIDVTDARSAIYELHADINMGGATNFAMAESAATAFKGVFRGAAKAGGGKYTISNFTIKGRASAANYTAAAGLFCYAQGASFENFAISNASISSAGSGTAILLGFADSQGTATGTTTLCSFTDIEISGCTVTSTRYNGNTSYGITTAAQAGALVGALWSLAGDANNVSTTNIYTFDRITVKDTIVRNTNAGGAWAIGGLIGESLCRNGTVNIGVAGASPSIVMEHVTVQGYNCVGGVIGMAGYTAPTGTSSVPTATNLKGGIKVVNAHVRGNSNGDSSITAGTGNGIGGCCGGILGADVVTAGCASISGCTVADTTITSNNDITTMTNYYTDCGGIAGHIGGTVSNCTVEDCTIKSCTPGGIVGRSSRKTASAAGTHLTISNCKVIGETTITTPSGISSNTSEAGGILSGGRLAEIEIQNCGVGPDVTISGQFLNSGGIVGYSTGTAAYHTMKISGCVSYATISITDTTSLNNAVVGGIFGNSASNTIGSSPNYRILISDCVVGGSLDVDNYFAGGVIGQINVNGNIPGMIKNCTVTASINTNVTNVTKHSAKLIGNVTQGYLSSGWMGNLSTSLPHNLISSSDPTETDYTYIGVYSDQGSTPDTPFENLITAYNMSFAGSVTDVNKPTRTTPANGSAAPYVHNQTAPVGIDGERNSATETVSVTNDASAYIITTSYDGTNHPEIRLIRYDHTDSTTGMVHGWISTVSATVEVTDVANTSSTTCVVIHGLKNGSAGVEGAYNIACPAGANATLSDASGNFKIPGTNDPVLIKVYIPVTCSNIAGVTLKGNGDSASDPYLIHNLDELDSLRTRDLSLGEYYAIVCDIDISASVYASGEAYAGGFTPIVGKNSTVFNGTLSGAYDYSYDSVNDVETVTVNDNASKTISGLQISGSTTNTGLFAQTNGATIKNISFSGGSVSGSGDNVALVVGNAQNTNFTNIHITGAQTEDPDTHEVTTTPLTVAGSGSGSVYAGALAAYAVNANVTGTVLSDVSVSGAYFTGGLFGHAHYDGTANKVNSIQKTTITNLTVTSTTTSGLTDANDVVVNTYDNKIDIAAGIAAEFSGTLGAAGSGNATTITGTGSITGGIASGVVGLTDETATCNCTITNVSITGTYAITSGRAVLTQAAAAGVVGRVRIADDETGSESPALTTVNLSIAGCTVSSAVTITAEYYAAGVVGSSGLIMRTSPSSNTISISNCESHAVIQAANNGNQGSCAIAGIVGRVRDLNGITISGCTVDGTLTVQGSTAALPTGTIGGVIGKAENKVKTSSATATVSDTLICPTMSSAAKRGVIIGTVTTTVLPTDLANSPFANVYYSSYQLGTMANDKLSVTSFGLSGEDAFVDTDSDQIPDSSQYYDDYCGTGKCVDLQSDMQYNNSGTLTKSLPLTAADLVLATSGNGSISIPANSTNVGTYAFESFTAPGGVSFTLSSVYSRNTAEPLFTYTSGTRTLHLIDSGVDPAVFEYSNGLKICFFIKASNIKGEGTQSDPYLIEEIGHLKFVKQNPDSYFILARDLDFSTESTNPAHEVAAEWAANWDVAEAQGVTPTDWVYVLTQTPFSGHLDGYFYESFDSSNTSNNTYPGYYGTMVNHSIKNLTISSSNKDVGFFPTLAVNADPQKTTTVQNITFDHCSFTCTAARSRATEGNAGMLAGSIPAGNITVSGITVSGGSVTANGHAGAIAGVSLTSISGCTVNNGAQVTASHCAGGIVGGGASVSGCTVTGATIKAPDISGGIVGGTMSFSNEWSSVNADTTEWKNTVTAARTALQNISITGCSVSGATITTPTGSTAISKVGGILGDAEYGTSTSGYYRKIAISNCTVDSVSTTDENRTSVLATSTAAKNYAGGIVGYLDPYYDGFEINSCQSYAAVSAYGGANNNTDTSAGGLIGMIAESPYFKMHNSGAMTFKIVNNVASGSVNSVQYAGGICGYMAFNMDPYDQSAYVIPNLIDPSNATASDAFISGNIISCTFLQLDLASTGAPATDYRFFGIFIGRLKTNTFADGATAAQYRARMSSNYYSSYVCNGGTGNGTMGAYGYTLNDAVTAVILYDVARDVPAQGQEAKSSFKVSNNYPESGYSFGVQMYGRSANENETYAQTVTLTKPVQLIFNNISITDWGTATNTPSIDFAASSGTTSLTVWSSAASGQEHTLSLGSAGSIYVSPEDSTYYAASVSASTADGHKMVDFDILQDPEDALYQKLVADLGYGLLVGITIDNGSPEDGTVEHPFTIPTAKKFASYFFGAFAKDTNNDYLSLYYKQTADIDFEQILIEIGNLDAAKARQKHFSPIGTSAQGGNFRGGYDGGGFSITNFHYSTKDYYDTQTSSYPDESIQDVGLFGYVSDENTDLTQTQNNYRLRNLHIELANGIYKLDGTEGSSAEKTNGFYTYGSGGSAQQAIDLASVCGGTNTGGLVGRYMSGKAITNCSVVYGTVRASSSAGGLIGVVGDCTLQNCFTSTNVRINDIYTGASTGDYNAYAAAGMAGSQYVDNNITSTYTNFVNCFTSSDVLAPMYASAFIGYAHRKVSLENCFSTATVFARMPNQGVSPYTVGPALMVGYNNDPGYDFAPYVRAKNVYIAGINTTEYSVYSDQRQFYPTLFGGGTMDTGSANMYYDAETIGRISVPNGDTYPLIMLMNGTKRNNQDTADASSDSSGLSGNAPKKTAQLTAADFSGFTRSVEVEVEGETQTQTVTDTENWSYSDAGLYPVLNMIPVTRTLDENDQYEFQFKDYAFSGTLDPYFAAYAKLSALPVYADERESDDVTTDRTYAGITYPTYVATTIDSSNITIAASAYSAVTNGGYEDYEYYDYKLVGNGAEDQNDTNHAGTDMNTDLLFNKQTAGKVFILRNTYLDFASSRDAVARNLKSPYVSISALQLTKTFKSRDLQTQTTSTVALSRQIRIGLRGSNNTVYISTERQLRALSVAETAAKFASLSTAVSNQRNIRICADIEFLPAPASGTDHRISFTPIDGYKGSNGGDSVEGMFSFDGSNCSISNLYINLPGSSDPVGMFSSFPSDASSHLCVSNLILRNVDITGAEYTGALLGQGQDNTKFDNCMVIGGTVRGTARTGGMIGSIAGESTQTNQTLKRLAVVGVEVIGPSSADEGTTSGFGILAGELEKVKIEDVYTVGKVTAKASFVGGLAGLAQYVAADGVVTSGYVETTKPDGTAGGVYGQMGTYDGTTWSGHNANDQLKLENAESTAYVKGGNGTSLGGIVGKCGTGSLTRVIFAGGVSSMATGGTGSRSTIAGLVGNDASVNTAVYDSSLNVETLSLDAAYTGLSTDDLISGDGKISNTAISNSALFGLTKTKVIRTGNNPGDSLTISAWTFDSNDQYYPNPIYEGDIEAKMGEISHVISDEFKVGLRFALARIDFSYAGMPGTIDYYTQISAQSPIATDATQTNAADTVSLSSTGYVTGHTDKLYLVNPQSGTTTVPNQLVSNAYEKDKTADVRAELSTASGATFDGILAHAIFRYLEVPVIRTVQVTYVINYDTGLTATGANSVGLSLTTSRNGTGYASNAVTSQGQDAANDNTVRFEKILCQGGISVDTILPDGFKATYSVPTSNTALTTSGAVWNSTTECIDISGVSDSYNDVVNVRLVVTIEKDPGWGLRDLTAALPGVVSGS